MENTGVALSFKAEDNFSHKISQTETKHGWSKAKKNVKIMEDCVLGWQYLGLSEYFILLCLVSVGFNF